MGKIRQKKIIVSVTSDLVSDNRVHKVCNTLTDMGFVVLLVGRVLPNSLPLGKRMYKTKRFRLLFTKGALFYAEYNFRLLLFLLFTKFDVVLANDLDSLTANFLASNVKHKPLVYDSHEYFTEVPELIGRPHVKKVWQWLERKMVPHIKHAYTVCGSIATIYTEKYGTEFKVVRNLPVAARGNFRGAADSDPLLKVVGNSPAAAESNAVKIVLYQGAINIGRGLEQAVLAMKYLENVKLIVAGDGDIKPRLEELVEKENLQNKVGFTGRLAIDDLAKLTPQADLGLSIEEDLGLNYRFALPNKLFDYIQAQVPVLVSNLPEMAAIVNRYQIGEITDTLDPEILAGKIKMAISDVSKRKIWAENLKIAARDLTWENEKKVLEEIYLPFLK